MNIFKSLWNDIREFVSVLRFSRKKPQPQQQMDPELHKKSLEDAKRFYLDHAPEEKDNRGSNVVVPDYPRIRIPSQLPTMNIKEFDKYFPKDVMRWNVKINNPRLIEDDMFDALLLAQINNPLLFTNPPTVRNKSRSYVIPVLMAQYFENIRLYETAIAAEYYEEYDYVSKQLMTRQIFPNGKTINLKI